MQTQYIKETILAALREDISDGDVTTDNLIPENHRSEGVIVAKESAVVCGVAFAKEAFRALDSSFLFRALVKDGEFVRKGQTLATLKGRTRAILTAERVALNFLSYFSAIATRTASFVHAVRPHKAVILDTRKTTPNMRQAERYAVRCGGGTNHRFNLNDMVLVKDNHRVISRRHESLADTVRRLRKTVHCAIEVEVDSMDELKEVLPGEPDVILLDNMNTRQLRQAVRVVEALCRVGIKRPLLEASGGITLATVKSVARAGVDRISIGGLTHSRKAIDFSLELNG